jgi:hypothetical protein
VTAQCLDRACGTFLIAAVSSGIEVSLESHRVVGLHRRSGVGLPPFNEDDGR